MTETESTPSRRKVAAGIGIALFLIIVVSTVSYYQLVLVPSQSAMTKQPEEISPIAEEPTTEDESIAEAIPIEESIEETPPEASPDTKEAREQESPLAITLTVQDGSTPWSFELNEEENPPIRLKQGDTIELTFVNDGNTVHDFTIEELGITDETTFLEPGEEVTITIKGEKTGTFTYFCAQPGHKDLGMFGELIVE
ncbi:MAG: cupredoxin domain-containing protein [Candidatus Bathyarchaeia archaeon]